MKGYEYAAIGGVAVAGVLGYTYLTKGELPKQLQDLGAGLSGFNLDLSGFGGGAGGGFDAITAALAGVTKNLTNPLSGITDIFTGGLKTAGTTLSGTNTDLQNLFKSWSDTLNYPIKNLNDELSNLKNSAKAVYSVGRTGFGYATLGGIGGVIAGTVAGIVGAVAAPAAIVGGAAAIGGFGAGQIIGSVTQPVGNFVLSNPQVGETLYNVGGAFNQIITGSPLPSYSSVKNSPIDTIPLKAPTEIIKQGFTEKYGEVFKRQSVPKSPNIPVLLKKAG